MSFILKLLEVYFLTQEPEQVNPLKFKNAVFLLQILKTAHVHSCMPSPLAHDPIRVQSCVCMAVTSIFLARYKIRDINPSIDTISLSGNIYFYWNYSLAAMFSSWMCTNECLWLRWGTGGLQMCEVKDILIFSHSVKVSPGSTLYWEVCIVRFNTLLKGLYSTVQHALYWEVCTVRFNTLLRGLYSTVQHFTKRFV